MPMLDAYIPKDALDPEAERKLLGVCTDLLIEHEGADPGNQKVRALSWVFVHRPTTYVGGSPTAEPHYRFVCQVPEGQYNRERRVRVTEGITDALVEAEGGKWPNARDRVWVFTFEVPDGNWGALGGRVVTLADIAEHVVGETGRRYGEKQLSRRRQEQARQLLEAIRVLYTEAEDEVRLP